MCGIAGIISRDRKPIDPNLLDRMAQALTHRGPDDRQSWIDPVTHLVGLAHTRLAVIDPQGGRQPMTDRARPSRRLVFNGEIYNHRSLRDSLQKHGHRFASHHSDTEVILPLYAEHGEDFLRHLRGMFALAIYDGSERRLILARDRLGQKPLYWTQTPRYFAFAGELKSLLLLPDVSRQLDLAAVRQYLELGYVPSPRTIFASIRKMPPATMMSVPVDANAAHARADTMAAEPHAYWHLPDILPPNERPRPAEARQRLYATLAEAVTLRMEADVPLGFFLSGGLDSSIVLALARQAAPARNLRTFTMSFAHRHYDESALAATMAAHVGAEHTVLQVEQGDILQSLADICRATDEPLADASALPTWLLSRAARSHATVVLSGDGGDELFGGYDRYRAARLAAMLDRLPPLRLAIARLALAAGSSGEMKTFRARLTRWARSLSLPPLPRYARYVSPFHESAPDLILGPKLHDAAAGDATAAGDEAAANALDYLARHWPAAGDDAAGDDDRHMPIADAMLRLDLRTYLPEDVLVKVDRMSMAHGLEIRSPMLDHHFVELAMQLPASMKAGRAVFGRGKALLRRTFGHLLPPEILHRRDKMGLGLPVSQLLADLGPQLITRRLLTDSPLPDSGLVNPATVQRYITEHFAAHAPAAHAGHTTRTAVDHGPRLWSLLILDEFIRSNRPSA